MDKIRILVVDDESRMRKLVRDFLVREGYEVLEAGDGEEALDLFYREKDIALIILDVMMPKRNGFEVCREIRETSKVPNLFLRRYWLRVSEPFCAGAERRRMKKRRSPWEESFWTRQPTW